MSWNTVKKSFLSLGNLPKRKTKDTCAWKNQGSHLVSLSYLLLVLPMSQSRVITVPSAGLNAPRRQILQSSFNSTWHGTILDSYAVAEQLLNSAGISRDQRSDRIFIPVPSFRRGWLCRLVTSYSKNVAPTNPSDLFVFSPHNRAEEIFRSACTAGIPPQMTLHFMPLREHWSTPSGTAADASLWSLPTFLSEYRQMGHWRLAFQFALADMLGYKYLWQLDDDSEMVLPVTSKLLDWMRDNDVLLGYRVALPDHVAVTWALPELTRTFLIAEQYQPVGPIFQHTNPPTLDGLYTTKDVSKTAFSAADGGGWDRMILFGNCIMFDLEFWFQPLVQRYIELVTSSWYHYRFRWNEQATIGMVWQLFVPANQSKTMPIPDRGYIHKDGYQP